MTVADLVKWTGGVATPSAPSEVRGAVIDSRKAFTGCLYAALPGENVDGHRFVEKALSAGAACALVRSDWEGARDDLPLVKVPDVKKALADAAHGWRLSLHATVVGITGSAGKTTTKELTAAFLSAGGKTHATAGNYNNDLGLPVTILNCPEDAHFLVVEMGTNHPGEIAALCAIAEPDVGLISSIGTAHIEFFRTQDGIADEKGTLFRSLARHPHAFAAAPFAVLARENERYARLKAMCAVPVVETSLDCAEAREIEPLLAEKLPGRHNVSNALIALACAQTLGVPPAACLTALGDFTLPGDRWRQIEKDGVAWVMDCYNANPTSMAAALETFAAQPWKGRKVAVLGDMFELGEKSAELHAMVKSRAAELPLDLVVYVGENFGGVTAEEARAQLKPGDRVFLKASHGMHLEKMVEAS